MNPESAASSLHGTAPTAAAVVTADFASAALRDAGGPRFVFYSHDGLGLGHVRRNLLLAGTITARDPQAAVLLVTSAPEIERLGLPTNVDVLRLPALRKLANESYAARNLPVTPLEVQAVRSSLLTAAVRSFRPTVLVADKHPFGASGELREALALARADGAHTVLGLRDILDDVATVTREWHETGLADEVADHYDRVLVYGDRDVFDPVREYDFPLELAERVLYCGYVVAPGAQRPGPSGTRLRGRPVVVATAGGGEDGYRLLSTFVDAAAGGGWDATAVTGPACPAAHQRDLQARGERAGVTVRTFVAGLDRLTASADALVCMGGYNTIVEAVASGVPTVCVPRTAPRREQLMRARAFAERGLLTLVEPEGADPATLRDAVDTAVARPPAARPALPLEGADCAARELLALAGEARARAAAVVPLEVVVA